MGKDHGNKLPEIPDWRIYRVEDVPVLKIVKKALAYQDLSNPWLRNEVWKFNEGTVYQRIMNFIKEYGFRGFKYGLIAAVLTTGVEHFFFSPSEKKDHH